MSTFGKKSRSFQFSYPCILLVSLPFRFIEPDRQSENVLRVQCGTNQYATQSGETPMGASRNQVLSLHPAVIHMTHSHLFWLIVNCLQRIITISGAQGGLQEGVGDRPRQGGREDPAQAVRRLRLRHTVRRGYRNLSELTVILGLFRSPWERTVTRCRRSVEDSPMIGELTESSATSEIDS